VVATVKPPSANLPPMGWSTARTLEFPYLCYVDIALVYVTNPVKFVLAEKGKLNCNELSRLQNMPSSASFEYR
jgi:hypothetical protein